MEKEFIREPVQYKKRVQRIFATDRIRSSGDKRISFVPDFGGGEKGDDLRFATVLILFRISVGESLEAQGYEFLQYMKLTNVIDTVDETVGCVCVRWSYDGEMDLSLRRSTSILEQGGLDVE